MNGKSKASKEFNTIVRSPSFLDKEKIKTLDSPLIYIAYQTKNISYCAK